MATMQKHKTERTKKTRKKQNQVLVLNKEEEEDEEIVEPPVSTADNNLPNVVQEIPEIVCSTGEQDLTPQQNVTEAICEQIDTNEDCQEPTAPPADEKSAPLILAEPTRIQYPNLQPMQFEEQKSQIIYANTPQVLSSDTNPIQPFTSEQLKEFYHCSELELVHQFELEFLMNSLLETHETDPLYVLLQDYYNLQNKLSLMRLDVMELRKGMQKAQQAIWGQTSISKTFSGRCGDGKTVSHTVSYNIMEINGKSLQTTTDSSKQLFDLVCYGFTKNSIAASIIKVKITEIVHKIILQPELINMANTTKNPCLNQTLNAEALQSVSHLRRAISILFFFVRKLSPCKQFTDDLRAWLNKLISLQLLIATKEDHWFLLFNLLRCPSGVGAWSAPFLQVPLKYSVTPGANQVPLPLNSIEMNNCIAMLKILLLPIKKRKEYLHDHKDILDPVSDECWTLVDSDGEDSHTSVGECIGLRENDLIAFLSQIPFEQVFISALNIEKFLNDYIIQPNNITGNHVLRVIAFFSQLVNIFGEGMVTYNTERYKQFAKRLGRLMRHTLQYASDLHAIFMNNSLFKDASTCQRIELELNVLLFRACSFIYNTRNLSTWQYFSTLPYSTLKNQSLWQLFYYLNVGFPKDYSTTATDFSELFQAADFWQKFNVANADLSAEDLYYLIQAFFEIANNRHHEKDWQLIKAVGLHIFNIGFLNVNTRETCYKASRDILVNLTLAYEDLFSCLLLQLKVRFSEIENASYLFKSLPLENWKPGMDSFEVLSNWLLHFEISAAENQLARLIISRLNWGFDCEEKRLFLPHNIHVRMACLVTEAATKHAPELLGISSFTQSVRQVSNLVDFTQTPREEFSTWCWNMVSILRLHLMDQCADSVKQTLHAPTETLMFVPELERLDIIYQGISEKRPLAIYVGMLVSLHGHSIPLICQKGFEFLKQLVDDNRHTAVIRCLELIVPLFISTPETLANCENFQNIILNLFQADRTYLKMAKDAIYAYSVGPVLELLDNMIHYQITNYKNYALSTPLNLINVWLNCLTSIPNWPNTSVVYLLDKILGVAYQFPDARPQAVEFFYNYYKDCDVWKGNNKVYTLKSLFSTTYTRIPTLHAEQPWLALVLLEIEFKTQEVHFWPEFLRQLAAANSRNPLEAVLKKTAQTSKFNAFPASMLVLYKYATLIANMDVKQPLFPIINQKFFEIYLSRAPLNYDENRFQTTFGVTDKFYEFNVPLMKKVKSKLLEAEAYYTNEAASLTDDEALGYVYRNCAKITKTYLLWLEETNINKHTQDEQNLPPQYNVEKLLEIFHGNTEHWTEFLYLPAIRAEQKKQATKWSHLCLRGNNLRRSASFISSEKSTVDPIERIKRQLSSYDKIQSPPSFEKPKLLVVNNINMQTFKEMQAMLKVLNSSAKKFNLQTSELSAVVRNYLEKIHQLYTMNPYTQVYNCNCGYLLTNCKSPAKIVADLEQISLNKEIEAQLTAYCERHESLIDEILTQKRDQLVRNYYQLNEIVQFIAKKHNESPNKLQIVTVTGTNFFYEVVESFNDVTMKFPTTNEFYTQIMSDLGIVMQDNQETQGLIILRLVLKRPELAKMLYEVFMPSRTRPEQFLAMYSFLIDSYLKRCDMKILFVLLSKFDLPSWLEKFHPKLVDISQLLKLVMCGLECWSKPEAVLLQDQFRRHLVHIFNYDFPQHYGEVMMLLLTYISEQKVMPDLLLDILNTLLLSANCNVLSMQSQPDEVEQVVATFARQQQVFNLTAATETCMMFARHFQKERLTHGLHGLYPKHKDYCKPLAMWFSAVGHVVVTTAICTYQELLADQICDTIFGFIADMYAPWLIPYTDQTLPQPTANWMSQLREQGEMLLPWSEQHARTSKVLITPFMATLNFVLENLPASHKILDHTFAWYVHHFAVVNMPKHINTPIQRAIATLPWERFKPQIQYIDMLYDSLQKFIPDCHAMLGHIFIRINWNNWFVDVLNTLSTLPIRIQAVSRLFCIFIKIAFEPNIHMQPNLSRILEDAIHYPWYLVSYAELENLLKWFVKSVDPCLILKMPMETNYADRAVLDLLQLVCAMRPEHAATQHTSHATAKRILYARTYVQLLRLCAAKNQKLLATKDGSKRYKTIFIEFLINIDKTLKALANTQTTEECRKEALNLLIEIIVPMQTQSEQTSNLHIEAIVQWQDEECSAGNILLISTLNAIGHMKLFIAGIYMLLESSISHYFRSSEMHTPTWSGLFHELQMSMAKLELMPCINGTHLHTLNIFIVYQMAQLATIGDKITFLQNLAQLLEPLKTNPMTEPRLAAIWGLMIARGSQILLESQQVKKPLYMLAQYLNGLTTQSEGWSDGLLGAIGLKKESITIKRRILTRCLICVIYSLFPNINSGNELVPNQDFNSAYQELSLLLAYKKYAQQKSLVIQAVGVINECRTPSFSDVPHLLCRLIANFYQNDFLTTIPEIWDFDFQLT